MAGRLLPDEATSKAGKMRGEEVAAAADFSGPTGGLLCNPPLNAL